MTWDNDYAYIQVFIDFLKQILEMIKSLFSGGAAKDETEDENADA